MTDHVIRWERVLIEPTPLDRWAARVTSPYLSVEFATVNWAELCGLWVLSFMPRGPGIENPCTLADFATREKAMASVGHWASHHWRLVPAWQHPQRWGAG